MNKIWTRRTLLLACGVLLGVVLEWCWQQGLTPALHAQQRQQQPQQQNQQRGQQPQQRGQQPQRGEPLPTMESLPEEVARLKALLPSNSHIMMDVQWHWTNLWFA